MNGANLKAAYRTAVTEAFPERIALEFGERRVEYTKVAWPTDGTGLHDTAAVGLRYGENPHQPAAFYAPPGASALGALTWLKLGKGGPSWINLADIEHAMRILRFFADPAAVVMKHLNPSGAACRRGAQGLREVYAAARDCDARAAFGGVVVLNETVDEATAEEIGTTYVEVVAAPGLTPGALEILGRKKDLRIASIADPRTLPRFLGDDTGGAVDLKVATDGSLLVQMPYLTRIRSAEDFMLNPRLEDGTRAELIPTPAQLFDLLLAWYVNTGVRSNGIVFARDGRTLAVGTGEQERVGAVEQAIAKARQKGHDLRGAVMSSDAFFPFRDAVDACAAAGVSAIVQPGGSVRDGEVVAACNEHGIGLVFTGERCFGHF
ncbi:MAG: IMP cyclohydrolase [Candidatus Sericytochromatia bacterium]|nr:IMP cyclohydrolase [Candidatus Tanganyikabacteria bacterium]